jgi:uncharacterized membrane protein
MNRSRAAYLALLAGTILWCAGILLAPACKAWGDNSAGAALYQWYHPICHQIPERSFFLEGFPLGVCSRCSAIYFAFLLGTLLYPLLRHLDRPVLPPRWLLLVVGIPMLIDATGLGSLIYEVTSMSRALTGALFGLALPSVLLPAALQAVGELFATARHPQSEKGLSDAH